MTARHRSRRFHLRFNVRLRVSNADLPIRNTLIIKITLISLKIKEEIIHQFIWIISY